MSGGTDKCFKEKPLRDSLPKKQIILGRCDYENLMPATIGIRSIIKR